MYPKIEVIRQEISDTPVSNPEGRFLIATDINIRIAFGIFGEEVIGIDDIEGIASMITNRRVRGDRYCGFF